MISYSLVFDFALFLIVIAACALDYAYNIEENDDYNGWMMKVTQAEGSGGRGASQTRKGMSQSG